MSKARAALERLGHELAVGSSQQIELNTCVWREFQSRAEGDSVDEGCQCDRMCFIVMAVAPIDCKQLF